MKITCNECGHINIIKNPEVFRGLKNVVFHCKNKSCKTKIKFQLSSEEKEQTEDQTVAIFNNSKIKLAFLEYKNVDDEKVCANISLGVNHLGRQSKGYNQEIQIETNDRHMSRTHAVLIGKSQDGNFMSILRGYNTKNKIILNGRVISEAEEIYLMEGDEIVLGTTSLIYKVNYH